MREGAQSGVLRFIFFGLMGLATFGLVLTDAGGFFNGGIGRQTIAKIGDVELSLPLFHQIFTREINRNNIPPELARSYGIPQMVLAREINRLTLVQAGYESQIRIGDPFVAKSIKTQLDQAGLTGDDDAANLDFALRQMNMSEAQFTRGTREDIMASLMSYVTENTGKDNQEIVESIYRFNNEKRIAEIVTISPKDVRKNVQVSEDEMQNYYQQNQNNFSTPETRSVQIFHMTPDSIGRDIVIDDEMVTDFYERNKSEYLLPNSYQMTQVILNDFDQAEEAFSSLSERDFETLKDQGRWIKNDWFIAKDLPSEISIALKNADQSDIIGPVQSSLGHHIIKITDVKKDQYKPFNEVSAEIKNILRDQEIDQQIYNMADDLDNAIADGIRLSELSKQYDVTLQSIQDLTMNDANRKELPEKAMDRQDILETAFMIEKDEISPVLELSDGSFMLIQVTNIKPESVQSFEAVQSDIKKILKNQKENIAIQNKATDIMTIYNKGEKTLAELAHHNNLPFRQTRAVNRTPKDGVAVSTDEAQLIFSLTPDNDLSSLRVGSDIKIIRLNAIKSVESVPQNSDEIKNIQKALKQNIQAEMQQQFVNAWKDDIGVQINTPLFQQNFLQAPETE